MAVNKIKIVFVIDGLEFGGTQRQLLYLLNLLDKNKYEIFIIYFTDEEDFLPEIDTKSVSVCKIKKNCKLDISLVLKIREYLIYNKADILVTFLITADIWARLAGFSIRGLKIVSCKRNQNNLGAIKTLLMAVMDRFTDRIVANCNDVKEYVRISEKLSDSDIEIIHNGYDLDTIRGVKNIDPGYDGFVLIGTVGRMVDVKDHEFFIKIADVLLKANKKVIFFIVGDGPNYNDILKKINTLGYAEQIKLLGSRPDALSLTKSFDIYISTSKKEGFSNSVMEAMILGKALWTTNVGAAKDLIVDGENGCLISKDMNADKICCLYEQTLDNLNELKRKALETSEDYTIRNMVSKYDTLFKKLMVSS